MNNKPQLEESYRMQIFSLVLAGVCMMLLGSYVSGRMVPGADEVLVEETVYSPLQDIEIRAKAAYVYDTRTGNVLFAKNEEERLPLASLTKVMSALVASELGIDESTVVVSAEALKERGDSGLRLHERWSLKDLLDFALATSSNDGMKAVALSLGALSRSDASPDDITADFVRQMNEMAVNIGMKNTRYLNVTGLDESEVRSGAMGTARDMALLFDYVLRHKPNLLEATREREIAITTLDNNTYLAKNTGYIVSDIPGIKASKTGYTSIAGGNLVVAFDPEMGRPVVVVVLGSTYDGRFEDVLKLMRASMEYLER